MNYIFLIGSSGFLGKHTYDLLIQRKYNVICLDKIENSSNYKEGLFERVSINDIDTLTILFKKYLPKTVILLVSYSSDGDGLVISSNKNPRVSTEINLIGLINVIECCKNFKSKLIWTSSTTVYGNKSKYTGKANEESLLNPESLYAASKVFNEQMIYHYVKEYKIHATIIRPTLIWGPGLKYNGIQKPFNDMVISFKYGIEKIIPYCYQNWDLIYVKDVALAILFIIKKKHPPFLLLVNGYTYSIKSFFEELNKIKKIPIIFQGKSRTIDIPLVDDKKIRGLGFKNKYDFMSSINDYK